MTGADSTTGRDAPLTVTNTGNAYADRGGKANTGIWIEEHHHPQPPPPPASWPVRVGKVPGLASAFQTRSGVRDQVEAARRRSSGGVVLTQTSTQVLSGGGGVGKSQLAAAYAVEAMMADTDLLVWVDAATSGAVISKYAQAGAGVQAPRVTGQPADVEADARAFLDWAANTKRSWLIVLDDITDPAQITNWWPTSHTRTGWVLATTRHRDADLTGNGRVLVDVDAYTPDEAQTYLAQRLTDTSRAHLLDDQAPDLAEALGRLPLALSHAAAYMIDQQVTCSGYLALYAAGSKHLDELMLGDPDGHARLPDGSSRAITVTLLLGLDAADACEPIGLARPTIRLCALLDPAGQPQVLWTSDRVARYLTDHRIPPAAQSTDAAADRAAGFWSWLRSLASAAPAIQQPPVTAEQTCQALTLLHRYGLITLDRQARFRDVRIHALTARAARETTPADNVPTTVRAAADAVLAICPDNHHAQPDLTAILRANADTLNGHAGDLMWTCDGGHPLLGWVGLDLLHTGLSTAAIIHYQRIAAASLRVLGPGHLNTLTVQGNLAASYWQAGRAAEAITILEQVAPEMAQALGPDHPNALMPRVNLAVCYTQVDRAAEAITILEQAAPEMAQALGPNHPNTQTARNNLAFCYAQVGRAAEAITIQEEVAATPEMAQTLATCHPNVLIAQGNLAASHWQAGRVAEAITILEQVAPEMAQALGPDHPNTLHVWANLANAYGLAGRVTEAITIWERDIPDRIRITGMDHPDTLMARANLAACYAQVDRIAEAITILEQVASEMAQTLGPDHPDTLAVISTVQEWKIT